MTVVESTEYAEYLNNLSNRKFDNKDMIVTTEVEGIQEVLCPCRFGQAQHASYMEHGPPALPSAVASDRR